VSDLPLGPLPDEVRVSLAEIGAVVAELELVMRDLASQGQTDAVARVDALIARMTRWVWPWLGEPGGEG
jgi:hypothetical protein